MFCNYPRGLDPTNIAYTVAEIFPNNTERAYPNATYQTPPQGLLNNSTTPASSAGNPNYLTGVQSVVIDPADRLWILDTGRIAVSDGSMLLASPGGVKLVGVDLTTNEVFKTIVFDTTAAPSVSVGTFITSSIPPSNIPHSTSTTCGLTFPQILPLQAKVSPTSRIHPQKASMLSSLSTLEQVKPGAACNVILRCREMLVSSPLSGVKRYI